MPQNQGAATVLSPSGGLAFATSGVAAKAKLNVTAEGVVEVGPGRFHGLLISAPGATSGAYAVYDSATVGGIGAANLIGEVAYNATANVEGAVLMAVPGGVPFTNGLVINVPGGSPICTVLYS